MGSDILLHKMSVTFFEVQHKKPKKGTNAASSEMVRDLCTTM